MNLDDNQFNLENYILNNIKLIYETLSINKSIFIFKIFDLILLRIIFSCRKFFLLIKKNCPLPDASIIFDSV